MRKKNHTSRHFEKIRIPMRVFVVLPIFLISCQITFNFSGGKADTSLETLSISQFINEADIVVPYLAQEVTQQIQDKFLSQSRLTLTSGSAADVELGGSITRYSMLPVAIQGDDRAAQNRLTIAVKVKFVNNVDPSESWEQSFSKFVDFDSDEDFTSVERDKINEVLEQITQDVFSKSIGKW
ncbi:MAG: LPS assembly lipoprotein LptE [Bacteroidia bacterium]|nr:LPS assembly lipoprotein LptE [Bacteroidia bacterium]